jgi:transposase-like protein
MERRVPASERAREALRDLIEGRLPSAFGQTELFKLATRLIVEQGLEVEVRDALGREYNERGAGPAGGHRNGVRKGRLKTAEGFIDYSAPRSPAGMCRSARRWVRTGGGTWPRTTAQNTTAWARSR